MKPELVEFLGLLARAASLSGIISETNEAQQDILRHLRDAQGSALGQRALLNRDLYNFTHGVLGPNT